MSGLLSFSRLIDTVNEKIGRAMSWAILAAVLVSSINATIRYAFNTSSNTWLELQWVLFSAVFLLGAAYTFRQNEHIRIDIVSSRLSKQTRHIIDIIGHLVFLMPFAGLLIWLGVPNAWKSFSSGRGFSGDQAEFLLALIVFFAIIAYAAHLLPRLKSPSARSGAFLPACIGFAAALLVNFYVLYLLAQPIMRFWEQSSSAGGMPTWPARFLIPIGFILLFLQGVSELIKRIAVLQGRISDPYAKSAGAHGAVE